MVHVYQKGPINGTCVAERQEKQSKHALREILQQKLNGLHKLSDILK